MASTYKTTVLTDIHAESRRFNEHNDCTVRALAIAARVPYQAAHSALAAAGRPHRRGPKAIGQRDKTGAVRVDCPAIRIAANTVGMDIRRLERTEYAAKTVATAPRDSRLQEGSYILYVRGHVAALVDGEVIDWTDGRRHRIQEVYELKPRQAAPVAPVAPVAPMQRMSGFIQGKLF